jgi:heme-degrading monooxygenase HmoA
MIAKTPAPPYYAVIFSSVRTNGDNGYSEMSERMVRLATEQEGFLGMESARDGLGITVSYWRDHDSIIKWRENSEHSVARNLGRAEWYASFKTRVARVERDYEFETGKERMSKPLNPRLNEGSFIYCSVEGVTGINMNDILFLFKEGEGITMVLKKEVADNLGIKYSFVSSWITLELYSGLEETGLTALFSRALSGEGISCNVVAAYNHDHLFVSQKDTARAMEILSRLSF